MDADDHYSILNPSIRVRLFRSGDLDNVRALFLFAMSNGPNSTRLHALHEFRHRYAQLAYLFIFFGCSTFLVSRSYAHKVLGLALSASTAVVTAGSYFVFSRMFIDYYNKCLAEDLLDIPSHYRMERAHDGLDDHSDLVPIGASAFWVAENDFPDVTGMKIVGCIGLDCRNEGNTFRAEIRRMCLSPYHRRKGIAAVLVRTALAHAKVHHISYADLETTQFQENAIALYKKLGWTETGRRVIYDGWRGLVRVVLIQFRIKLFP